MGMTIETQIKALEYLKNCGIFPFSDTKTGIVFDDKFIDAAIETMHKYQKIEQIISDGYLQGKTSGEMLLGIKGVMNGNDG